MNTGARFPRRARLLKPAEYSRVFKKPVRSSDRLFTILASPSQSPEANPRLGLAISKKNAKHAVDRNRIKRIIRESFRHRQQGLSKADFVVMAKPVTKNSSKAELFKSLEQHWSRLAGLCKKSS